MESIDDPLLFRRVPARLPRTELRSFARLLIRGVAHGRGFHCLFTDDRELRRLNRQFLGKDEPTDVLSFPEPGPDGYLGEIAISVDRARLQAQRLGHSLAEELKILMLHGLLHLLGLDHETDSGQMARRERRLRTQLGLPAGLIERAKS